MAIKETYTDQIYSYFALRRSVGWIGILLPFILVLGMILIFKGDAIQKTISQYYYTGMRDVLVGSLCSIALFLFFYKGYSKMDNWSATLAGFFALGIALFPTTEKPPDDLSGTIHFISASLFFITLAGISLLLFTRKGSHPTKQKQRRNVIYIICGLIMLISLVSILIFFNFIYDDKSESHFVFWAESVALIAFGVSWLTKGGSLYPD